MPEHLEGGAGERRPGRRALRALSFLLLLASMIGASPGRSRAADGGGRVVILGFDGADANLVEKWMDEGKLPNLDRLRREGTYARLLPTNPPQTPVSWSSFATGNNPGRTQIFDFLKRTPRTYIPTIVMVDESKRPFLFGRKNPLALGGIAAALAFVACYGALSLLRTQVLVRALVGLASGILLFVGVFWIAGRFLPAELTWAVNSRKGETFWAAASAKGHRPLIFRVPATFPAEPVGEGKMLSGLGVPDMRGTIGRPTYYTSEPSAGAGDNEFAIEMTRLPARSGVIETKVIGPHNKPFYDYVLDRASEGITDPEERARIRARVEEELARRKVPSSIEIPLTLDTTTPGSLTIRVGSHTLALKPGEWSDWVVFDYPVNWLVDRLAPVRGIGRFQLFSLQPELRLWLSPINFHPEFHPIPFTYPAGYADELFQTFGFYKTLGWTEDTWSLPSGIGDEEHFLDDMNASIAKDEEMMHSLLAKKDCDLYVQVYSFTDRIGHLFWRFIDPLHPLYDAEKAARYGPEIEKAYRHMDAIVGKARETLGPKDRLIVCSDHGFSSYRRGVSYNTWLVRNGYMTLKGEEGSARTLEDLFDKGGGALFQNVDWSRTKAYAMGLGNIYVNLYGREPQGIVQEGAEYEAVVRGIKEGLESLVDEKTGEHPVARVYHRDEIYSGFDPALIPDLRAANALNYRVSWQTTLGGVPPQVIDDNLKAWSGDHCSNDPELVKGILFSSVKFSRTDPRIADLAPSVLALLGIPAPAGIDGRSLFASGQ